MLLALLAVGALAPAALAQATDGEGLLLVLDPPGATAPPGATVETQLRIHNREPAPAEVALSVQVHPTATLETPMPATLTLAPGTSTTLPLRLRLAHDAPAGQSGAYLEARAAYAGRGERTAGALFDVRVDPGAAAASPAASAPLPPDVTPRRLAFDATPGAEVARTLYLANPNDRPLDALVSIHLPDGWTGRVEPAHVNLAPRGNATVAVTVLAGAGARDANATLRVGAANVAWTDVPLELRVAASPPSSPPASQEPPVEASAPTSGPPAEGVSTPASAAASPPEDAPTPPEEAPASEPSESATFSLAVEPDALVAPPGGAAGASVRVTNTGGASGDVELRLSLPNGLQGALAEERLTLAPGETRALELRLDVPADAAWGREFEGAVETNGARATFRLRIDVVAPKDESRDEPSTPASVGGGSLGVTTGAALAVAGALAGTVALSFPWLRRQWPFLAALYTRLLPHKLLDHPQRAAILAHIDEHPGVTVNELKRALDLPNGVAAHHLHALERAGIVRSSQDGQQRRLYGNGAAREAPVPDLGERLLALLAEGGARRATDVARALRVSRQALHYHVKRLAASGRLVLRREGAEVWLEAPGRPPPSRVRL